jgi:Raf kinase inhibitor-like YbhB/YbcL family protein
MRQRNLFALWACLAPAALLLMSACSNGGDKAKMTEESGPMDIQLISSAFEDGNPIPAQYTCQGKNISPPLAWSSPPAGAKSVALILDDPDAPRGTWVHWVVYNLPADTIGLPEAVKADSVLPGNALQGKNDYKRNDYSGPCPPSGTHRYYFKIYALDTALDLKAGATKDDVLHAMEGHVLAHGQLMGTVKK